MLQKIITNTLIPNVFHSPFPFQLVQWINDAGLSEGTKRANLLRKIIEVMIHQAPQSIPTYIENVLSFVSDKSTDVKKQVVAFIEELRYGSTDQVRMFSL